MRGADQFYDLEARLAVPQSRGSLRVLRGCSRVGHDVDFRHLGWPGRDDAVNMT